MISDVLVHFWIVPNNGLELGNLFCQDQEYHSAGTIICLRVMWAYYRFAERPSLTKGSEIQIAKELNNVRQMFIMGFLSGTTEVNISRKKYR